MGEQSGLNNGQTCSFADQIETEKPIICWSN